MHLPPAGLWRELACDSFVDALGGFDEQEFIKHELFQLEKELTAECLDVANTGREFHPLGWVMIFLVIIQAPVQGLSQ